jgi:periplasmic protein TonB
MKTQKGTILLVAVIMALAAGLALTPSCKNAGNTNKSVDTAAINAMNARRADSIRAAMRADSIRAAMKADSMKAAMASMPKKSKPMGMVVEPVPVPTEKIVEDKNMVYNHAEVGPFFPGGESALDDYVNDNVHYPGKAMDHGVEGKVMVHFIVDEHGNVTNVTTLGKPIGYGLEEEAVRVMSKSPKWTPGTVKGKNVKSYVILPIAFTLQ